MISRRLFNISFPRSGHHFVEEVLRHYFGEAFVYCGLYGHCHATPCTRETTVFQKNHDLWLNTPILTGEQYLVLYRHPYPALQSYFDLYVEMGWLPPALDTRETWAQWLDSGLRYWAGLVERWVIGGPEGRHVLSYEDLTADPVEHLAGIIALMAPDVAVDRARLTDILSDVGAVRQMPGDPTTRQAYATRFAPRKIEAFRYYDTADLVRANACVDGLREKHAAVGTQVRWPLQGRQITLASGQAHAPQPREADPTLCVVALPDWTVWQSFLDTLATMRPLARAAVTYTSANHLLPIITLPKLLVDPALRHYVALLSGEVIDNPDADAVNRVARG